MRWSHSRVNAVARIFRGPGPPKTVTHRMKYTTVLVSLSLLAGCAPVDPVGYVQPPPARYDKPASNVSVQYASKSQIKRFCGDSFARGCAYAIAGGCTIIVPPGTDKGSTLYRHEMAHCNGWAEQHSG